MTFKSHGPLVKITNLKHNMSIICFHLNHIQNQRRPCYLEPTRSNIRTKIGVGTFCSGVDS